MNLFFLDYYLEKNANALCDKHCVKMILESTQMLYTAWHMNYGPPPTRREPYKKAHTFHPMSIWVRSKPENYFYTCYYALLLCAEYTQRFTTKALKEHKCEERLRELLRLGFPPQKLPMAVAKKPKTTIFAYVDLPYGISKIPLCMPVEYVVFDENKRAMGIASYRNYYNYKKISKKWKMDRIPLWYEDKSNESIDKTLQ